MKTMVLENNKYLAELTKTYRLLDMKLKNLKKRYSSRNSNQKLDSEIFSLNSQVMDIINRLKQSEKNNINRLDDLKKINVSTKPLFSLIFDLI